MDSDHKVWVYIIVAILLFGLGMYGLETHRTNALIKNGYCQKVMYNGTSKPEVLWVKCDLLKCN